MKIPSSLPLILLGLLTINPAARAVIINGVDYTTHYDASSGILPAVSSPAWTYAGAGGGATGSMTFEDGALKLTTTALATDRGYLLGTPAWDASANLGSTVEFSLKVTATLPLAQQGAASVSLQRPLGPSSSQLYLFYFTETSFGITGADGSSITYSFPTANFKLSQEFITFRITLGADGNAALYALNVSGWDSSVNLLPSAYGGRSYTSSALNRILFGDVSSVTGGTSHWKSIAFTNAGAYAPLPTPVPEPAIVFLLPLGAILLHRFRQKAPTR